MFATNFTCPHCGRMIACDASLAGQVVACPGCSGHIQMPVSAITTPPPTQLMPTQPHTIYQEAITTSGGSSFITNYRARRKQKGSGAFLASLILLMLLTGALGGVAYWVVSHQNVGAIITSQANGSKSSTATDSSSVINTIKSAFQKPGKLRLTVTWQYNKFVGTKPDTDAIVMLVPLGFSGKVDFPFFGVRSLFDQERLKLKAIGVHLGVIGGDGKTLISEIPPGEYHLIIQSNNTSDELEYGESRAKRFKVIGGGKIRSDKKILITSISIIGGEEVEYNHDFGNTYF